MKKWQIENSEKSEKSEILEKLSRVFLFPRFPSFQPGPFRRVAAEYEKQVKHLQLFRNASSMQ